MEDVGQAEPGLPLSVRYSVFAPVSSRTIDSAREAVAKYGVLRTQHNMGRRGIPIKPTSFYRYELA